jgi:hypothetical protein
MIMMKHKEEKKHVVIRTIYRKHKEEKKHVVI